VRWPQKRSKRTDNFKTGAPSGGRRDQTWNAATVDNSQGDSCSSTLRVVEFHCVTRHSAGFNTRSPILSERRTNLAAPRPRWPAFPWRTPATLRDLGSPPPRSGVLSERAAVRFRAGPARPYPSLVHQPASAASTPRPETDLNQFPRTAFQCGGRNHFRPRTKPS
jgi:hypothetical protein